MADKRAEEEVQPDAIPECNESLEDDLANPLDLIESCYEDSSDAPNCIQRNDTIPYQGDDCGKENVQKRSESKGKDIENLRRSMNYPRASFGPKSMSSGYLHGRRNVEPMDNLSMAPSGLDPERYGRYGGDGRGTMRMSCHSDGVVSSAHAMFGGGGCYLPARVGGKEVIMQHEVPKNYQYGAESSEHYINMSCAGVNEENYDLFMGFIELGKGSWGRTWEEDGSQGK